MKSKQISSTSTYNCQRVKVISQRSNRFSQSINGNQFLMGKGKRFDQIMKKKYKIVRFALNLIFFLILFQLISIFQNFILLL